MTNDEINLSLVACISSVSLTLLMLAHDLHGRIEPGALDPEHAERLTKGLNAMVSIHNHFAHLGNDMRRA